MPKGHLELSFVTEDTLGSWFIRQGTHSDYSHVDIITPDGWRIGARTDHPVWVPQHYQPTMRWQRAGVQKRAMDYAPFTRDDRLFIRCSAPEAAYAYSWLNDQLGKPYDKSGLYAAFLLNRKRPMPFRDEAAWWCSELACVFIEKAGFPLCATPANRMSPNDTLIYGGCFGSVSRHPA